MMSGLHVNVTTHALMRWNERSSRYANESGKDLINAFYTARKIEKEEPLPIVRLGGLHYYFSEEFDCYFICDPKEEGIVRIVTVISRDLTSDKQRLLVELYAEKEKEALELKAIEKVSGEAREKKGKSKTEKDNHKILGEMSVKQHAKVQAINQRIKAAKANIGEDPNEVFRPDGSVNVNAAVIYILGEISDIQCKLSEYANPKTYNGE